MAQSGQKITGAPPKANAQGPAGSAPKTAGSVNPTARTHAQKLATAQPADPVGDICLIPEIARFAH
jgi:hypothetical protein